MMHLFMDTDIIAISLLGGYRLPLHLRGTYIFLHHIATAATIASNIVRSCFAKRESNKTANFIQLHTILVLLP